MFKETIHVTKVNQIRYGTTGIPFVKTYGEILALLAKHGCDQIATMKDGNIQKIAFVYQKHPFIIQIPQVFVKGIYNDKIGIRIVLYYLEIILDMVKERVIDFEFLMLGARIVQTDEGNMTLKDAVDKLPTPELFGSFKDQQQKLGEGTVIDVEPSRKR